MLDRRYRLLWFAMFAAAALSKVAAAADTHIRVSQVGYEENEPIHRAYLMTSSAQQPGGFRVQERDGRVVFKGVPGPLLGQWEHKGATTYRVYALDFPLRVRGSYHISLEGPLSAESPFFAVDRPERLYSGLLLNSKFFYETQRDGRYYVPNDLRHAPGHLKDAQAAVYFTPPLDEDDNIATTGQALQPTGAIIDAEGGWWDAGDYMKYVETVSYTVALQEIGIREFPFQIGHQAPVRPAEPPLSISYSGNSASAPASADFSSEADFGIDFLLRMWDDRTRTLYYQVGNSQDWANFSYLSDYDIWRLPEDDDRWEGCSAEARFICRRPVFAAGAPGSKISPNLAGRLAADFAACYQLHRADNPQLAFRCLKSAESVFDLADTSLPDPAASVDSGTCKSGCLLTIMPFDGYPETVWDDDMELGATELYRSLDLAERTGKVPAKLAHTEPDYYLALAVKYAKRYIHQVYDAGAGDALNLYDVSGLAHYELYRALERAGKTEAFALTQADVKRQLLRQVDDAGSAAAKDAWGFGSAWNGDTTSHGAGISVMASEAFALTGRPEYNRLSRRWMANILGSNAWGSSFIIGAGSQTFPNCIQHQVANLSGALNGTAGRIPVLWGAATEGPASQATSGSLDGMLACPADGVDRFAKFNGYNPAEGAGAKAVYRDNVESYSTTEPAIDLTAASFLMWSWRLALAR